MPAIPVELPGSGGNLPPGGGGEKKPTPLPCRIIVIIVAIVVCILTIVVIRLLPLDQETVILLIRHAEKAAAPPNDPPLLVPEGETRARELVRVVGGAGIQKIYASEALRSQKTVELLALAIGQPVDTTFHANNAAGLVNDILANHRGQTVLVAHHSNTVPEIIQRLGGGVVPSIDEVTEFDRFYVVHHHRYSGAKVTLLRYGAAPPPP
jgi:broad specificity phosphatase PhoE